jgi:hypothetical protein
MRKLQTRFGIAEAGLVAGLLYLIFAAVGKTHPPFGALSLGCGALYMLLHYACHHKEKRPSIKGLIRAAIPPAPPPPPKPPTAPVAPPPVPKKPAPDTVVDSDTTIIEALKELRQRIDHIMAKHGGESDEVG